jgi:2-keto-4-pentenoate hydratase/2-oxohepta-3-ene-1,7-dioic acid hydratase in catechol pathway
MLLYRVGPEGFYAAEDEEGIRRFLHSDPFETRPGGWEMGRELSPEGFGPLVPVLPGKIVGIGRSYAAHARELDNPVPEEPVLFLKAPSALVGPGVPVVLPPESEQVEFEGEIAVVLRERLSRAGAEEAGEAVLGVTCACDVTARDLQKRDPTFARAKSFDTFCPLGPAIRLGADLADLTLITRVNGEERQRAHVREMHWSIPEILAYVSRMMTLEAADVVLTGTPSGVGSLTGGDVLEVEIPGVGILRNPVEGWRQR